MNELSFHEAIRSGDTVARLIYTDWLEDHNRNEEAKLLRSGCWCLVPAGSFWMGGGKNNVIKQQVEISQAFYLGTYPVTQEEWQSIMGYNPSCFSRNGNGKDRVKDISDVDLKQFPVENMSWDEVQEYLKKLNKREKNSEWTYRLPTSAQWEYACRGGAISEEECKYDFYFTKPTNVLSSDLANFNGNRPHGNAPKGKYLRRTTKVGSYSPNRLGLYDMHGNVWEWTSDLYDAGPTRILRGGSWGNSGNYCRASFLSMYAPWFRNSNVGFRLALSVRT